MAARKTTPKHTGKPSTAFDLVIAALEKNPDTSFAEVRQAAERRGLHLYPVVYGRAKALLGLVPTRKRRKSKQPPTTATKRRPGRPKRETAATSQRSGARGVSDLEHIVAQIHQLQRERDKARKALENIRDAIETALA